MGRTDNPDQRKMEMQWVADASLDTALARLLGMRGVFSSNATIPSS